MKDNLSLAVLGIGYWGPNLIRVLYQNKKCNKLYCFDISDERMQWIKSRYPGIINVNSYKELLNNPDIDGIIIATPISTHYKLAIEAISSGKDIFIEKPMCQSSIEAQKLIEFSSENNVILMVGHTFLFSPPVNKINEIIGSGELGEIYYISSSRVNLGLHQKDVSVIWDLAPHDFSIIYYWIKEMPSKISAFGKAFVQNGIPDVAFINMEFKSGCIANVQVSWLSPSKLRRTTIVGSKKMLIYDDTQSIEKVKIFDKGVNYKDPETFGEYQLSYRSGDIISPNLETYEPLHKELDHFVDCINNRKIPISDGHAGFNVIKMLEMAEDSINSSGDLKENKDALR